MPHSDILLLFLEKRNPSLRYLIGQHRSILFFEKNRFSINDNENKDKILYIDNKNNIETNIKKEDKKKEIKKLKKIAEEKMRYKISKVEEIDKLIITNK